MCKSFINIAEQHLSQCKDHGEIIKKETSPIDSDNTKIKNKTKISKENKKAAFKDNEKFSDPLIKISKNDEKNNDNWLNVLVILYILIKIYSPIRVMDIMALPTYAIIKMTLSRLKNGGLKDLK